MAAPFVQGRLTEQPLTLSVETECGHCGQAMKIGLDSELGYRVEGGPTEPLVFHPRLDWSRFEEPNIIDGF